MNKRWIGWIGAAVAWCSAPACDQELVLPGPAGPVSEAAGAPSSGITGAGGVSDVAEPPGRLPLPNGPLHGPIGGAGGEAPQLEGGGPAGPGDGRGVRNPSGDAGAASGGAHEQPIALPRVLWFSEYLEGTGSLKALEIYSVNPASLEGCELATYYNGKTEPARLALRGDLEAGGVQVLCSSGLASAQPNLCDRSTNLTFNGDDALALVCAGAVHDVFGRIGEDPGDAWAGSTMDHTLRRSCDIESGRTEGTAPFDPASEWSVLAPNQFEDLGAHDCPEPGGSGGAGGAGGASASP